MLHTPIYLFCMVVFPIIILIFFTSLMSSGQPENMPCGVVDNDNSAVTRALIRKLDAFQSAKVVAHYTNVTEARRAVQQGKIYAYLYIPEGTTAKLISGRQPKVSFYYSNVTLVAGALLFKDLKTITTLGSAAIGSAKLQMLGKTEREIKTALQPIALDVHTIGNPWLSYNIYLSTIMVPGVLMLFMLLITVYSIGTELKFGRSKEWMQMAGKNIVVALRANCCHSSWFSSPCSWVTNGMSTVILTSPTPAVFPRCCCWLCSPSRQHKASACSFSD